MQSYSFESRLPSFYIQLWCFAEAEARENIDRIMADMSQIFEGKAAWLLSKSLPSGTPIFIANSMPVRDVEVFGHRVTHQYNHSLTEVQMALMEHFQLL